MNNKTNIEEDMKYINLDLDILINNIRNLPEVTATAIVVNKQPLLLKFQSILTDTYRLQVKANKHDSLMENIEKAFKTRRTKVLQENNEPEHDIVLKTLQELLDTIK